ncbi:MAG: FAD-binding protein [Bacillota bacterium]
MYAPEMLASIERVTATRGERIGSKHPRLSPEEKTALLKGFHPDHMPDTMRPVALGPNQGDKMPHELADLLEAPSRLELDCVDLDSVSADVDVLVVGGGGAGASAALMASAAGRRTLLVTKLRLGDANTMMAQGGIQAASKADDSPAIHYLDVVGGGGFANVPELVRALVMDAPVAIQWLESLGCMFNKAEDGTLDTIHGGGTSRKRMHFARDYSGAEIMRTLRDEVKNHGIEVIEFCPAIELLLDEAGQCAGAVLMNLETGEYLVVRAKTVVVSTGGFGRLHVAGFPTTNHYGATADGLVMCYHAGIRLRFMDATQFHPTGVAFPDQLVGLLTTEKVRGLGAQLVNAAGHQFVYPLETRDAVSAAIIRECRVRGLGVPTPTGMQGVWLDSPMIDLIHGPGTVKRELPAMWRQYDRFGIDMAVDPILQYPTLHYQNGGITIDEHGATPVANLFVAGECSGGVHGRNRLMGNSLLDVVVYGRRAGRAAAALAPSVKAGVLSLDHVRAWNKEVQGAKLPDDGRTRKPAPMLLPDYAKRTRGVTREAV